MDRQHLANARLHVTSSKNWECKGHNTIDDITNRTLNLSAVENTNDDWNDNTTTRPLLAVAWSPASYKSWMRGASSVPISGAKISTPRTGVGTKLGRAMDRNQLRATPAAMASSAPHTKLTMKTAEKPRKSLLHQGTTHR
jgi:hypothetical protein